MRSKIHVVVSGRVQGVFFRYFTKENAQKLGLFGWVKNTGDGNVELVAEGEKGDLEKLIGKLRKGPPLATVRDLKVEWDDNSEEFTGFSVRY